MAKFTFRIIIFTFTLCIISISFYKYFFKSWTPYYQEKLYKEPRPLLIDALKIESVIENSDKKALDLGAGAGNDTAYLLRNSWKVWAHDKEYEAIRILSTRKDIIPYHHALTLLHNDFMQIPWNTLPLFNIIYAGYSLPFIDKNNFLSVWNNITTHLALNGMIAIHLFGKNHTGFNTWEKRSMTFFTREEILNLLQNFEIKLFEESCETNERNIIDHSFSIIAQKK